MEHTERARHARKTRRHRLLDKKLLSSFMMPILFVVLMIVAIILANFVDVSSDSLFGAIGPIVTSVLMLVVYQLMFRSEFDGVLRWPGTGALLAAPALLLALDNFIGLIREGGMVTSVPTALLYAAAPGIAEEIIFRAIPVSNWMRVSCKQESIMPCVLVSSLIFGVVHGLNGVFGAAVSSTIYQVFYAFCLGVLFCATFLRTGSILPTIIVHTLIDFAAFLGMNVTQSALITQELQFTSQFYVSLAMNIGFLIFGLYLLRPSKRTEVVALWRKKFHRA